LKAAIPQQQLFEMAGVTCKYKVLSSLLRLVTVENDGFKSQPLQIAKRWQ